MQQSSDSPVDISPSPSQSSAIMSTSTVIASAEKSAVYAAEIVIEQEFTDDLNDQTSVDFVELATRVVGYMTEVYSSFPGFIRVEVISFTNGSVVADTRVIFERNSSVTAQNFTNSLQTANITGNNSLDIIGVKVTTIESVPSSSATSIVMANLSTQIVPSQSLSSPSSNINVSVSKSSIVYSSMISQAPNATLISSIAIQQTEPSGTLSKFVSEVNIPLSQTATNTILLSSVSLLVSSTELTSVLMGDSNQSSLMPMPSSNVEPMSTQFPCPVSVSLRTNVSTSISILPSPTSRSISLSTLETISSFILSSSMEVSSVHVQRLESMTIRVSNVQQSSSHKLISSSVESGKKINLNISKSNLAYILFIFVLAERIIN